MNIYFGFFLFLFTTFVGGRLIRALAKGNESPRSDTLMRSVAVYLRRGSVKTLGIRPTGSILVMRVFFLYKVCCFPFNGSLCDGEKKLFSGPSAVGHSTRCQWCDLDFTVHTRQNTDFHKYDNLIECYKYKTVSTPALGDAIEPWCLYFEYCQPLI